LKKEGLPADSGRASKHQHRNDAGEVSNSLRLRHNIFEQVCNACQAACAYIAQGTPACTASDASTQLLFGLGFLKGEKKKIKQTQTREDICEAELKKKKC